VTASASALDALIDGLPRWVLVGGKGGVGKTTSAVAIAVRNARRGRRTLLLSTDPAHSLADALGLDALGNDPQPVVGVPNLEARQLDAAIARAAFLARWRDTLVTIVDRGTYLDREDVVGLIDAAFPGIDETMALLTLADIEAAGTWDRVVADTAPTGHTLRLLELPTTFRALVGLLDAMQDKHRFMVSALTHRYRPDTADAFLGEMRRQLDAIRAILTDRRRAALVLVSRPEPVVVAETERYAASLRSLGISLGAVIANAVPTAPRDVGALAALAAIAPESPHLRVPLLEEPPIGIAAIERWAARVEPWATPARAPRRTRARDVETPEGGLDSPARGLLTITAGKGGVGKTTVACALALDLAADDRPVWLVSTDPAPSIADALAVPIGDEDTPIDSAPGLIARQIDATRAFARWRETYSQRVDAAFTSLLGGALDAAHDRAIARELLALAPPGIDEVYALTALGDALAANRFAHVVIDPAPTGHLLRLLEMPELALDWTHRLLRMMLKYKELIELGDAAQELLQFARQTRAVRELLHDGARASVLVVALDEPLVRGETARLVSAVRSKGVTVNGVLWNRAAHPPATLSVEPPVAQFVAPEWRTELRGVEAIRRWRATWMPLGSRRMRSSK
jgi:arsenite/tail-anchored protein-transporting ATPase